MRPNYIFSLNFTNIDTKITVKDLLWITKREGLQSFDVEQNKANFNILLIREPQHTNTVYHRGKTPITIQKVTKTLQQILLINMLLNKR